MTTKRSRGSRYRTVGAISGHLPTGAERALDAALAEQTVGAQQERDSAHAEIGAAAHAATYRGPCGACGAHVYGLRCKRCALNSTLSHMSLVDGEWVDSRPDECDL